MNLPFRRTTLEGAVCLWVPDRNLPREPGGYAGFGGWNKGEVRYDPRSPRRCLESLAMHEMMHEVIPRTPIPDLLKKADEEFVVNELAPWLVMALTENPAFADFVSGR